MSLGRKALSVAGKHFPGLALSGVTGGSSMLAAGAAVPSALAFSGANAALGFGKATLKSTHWIFMFFLAFLFSYGIFYFQNAYVKGSIVITYILAYILLTKIPLSKKNSTFFLFMIFFITYAPTIGNFIAEMITDRFLAKICMLFFMLFGYGGFIILILFTASQSQSPKADFIVDILKIFFVVFILCGLFGAMVDAGFFEKDQGITGLMTSQQQELVTAVLTNVKDSLFSIPSVTKNLFVKSVDTSKQIVNESIAYATTGKTYEERVVESAGVEILGVTLSNFQLSNGDSSYVQGSPVSGWAVLEVKSLDSMIPLALSCYGDPTSKNLKGSLNKDSFNIIDYSYVDVLCTFPEDTFTEVGSHNMLLTAVYNYTTSGYLRRYFIDQDELLNMRRNDIDPLQYYSISSTDEGSYFTSGPVSLALIKTGLLQALSDEDETEFAFGIRIDENSRVAEGSYIQKISKLTLSLPSGFSLKKEGDSFSCTEPFTLLDVEECVNSCNFDDVQCITDCSEYSTYSLDIDSFLKNKIKTEKGKTFFKTPSLISCNVVSEKSSNILGGSNLGIKNFRAEVDYTYGLSTSKSFTIERLAGYTSTPSQKTLCGGTTVYWNSDLENIENYGNSKTAIAVTSAIKSVLPKDPCLPILQGMAALLWRGNVDGYDTYLENEPVFQISLAQKNTFSSLSASDVTTLEGNVVFVKDYLLKKMESDCLKGTTKDLDCAITSFFGDETSVNVLKTKYAIQLAKLYSGDKSE